MRDYQTKVNNGAAPDSITNTKFGAGEFNSLAVENENAVSRAGLTLAPADGSGEETNQLAQSLFLHGVKSSSFQAAGTVDAITLTPVSGASGVVIPADYDHIEGAVINFVPTGANTGAVTVSIGQTAGTQLSTKKLLSASGAALTGGELGTDRIEAYYDPTADGAAGAWLLTPWSSSASASPLTTKGDLYTYDTGDARLPVGGNGQVLEADSAEATGLKWADKVFADNLIHVQDQKPNGTGGGSTSAGVTATRTLNTVLTNEITGASLSSNRITLPAGDYYIEARAPVFVVGSTSDCRHQAQLYNFSGSTTILKGSSTNAGGDSSTDSWVIGRFTLGSTQSVEIRHFTENARTFGAASSSGLGEVYTDVKIWKVG